MRVLQLAPRHLLQFPGTSKTEDSKDRDGKPMEGIDVDLSKDVNRG
jgi:hypothetical protein